MDAQNKAAWLRYPLTKRAVVDAFGESLGVTDENVKGQDRAPRGWASMSVDGAWPLSRVRKALKAAGLTRELPGLSFVNPDGTVGAVCHGVTAHPTKNEWRTYCFELSARPNGR